MESWRWMWCHDPTEPSRPSMRCRPSYPRFDASENPQRTCGATDPIMGAKVRHNRDNRRQPEAFYRPGTFLQMGSIISTIRRYPCPQHRNSPLTFSRARKHGEAEKTKKEGHAPLP